LKPSGVRLGDWEHAPLTNTQVRQIQKRNIKA
jgi:hypothetical protein